MNEIIAIRPNTFLKFILQIVASNIWKDMEEKEKIPYTQGKSVNDALRKNYSMMTSKYVCMHLFQMPDVLSLSFLSGVIIVFTGILVTIGRTGGAGILFGWNIQSLIVGLIKSRSLFTSKYWDLMDQKIPS